ncbi:MAG: hypothetical protein JSS67_02145 [Bacteroidetes bacterium]|nr:hypothetical protein [Bacteroidota bacterium]
MDKHKSRLDIVNIVLEDCIIAYPVSSFVISLYKQYMDRGSLSKKQLQGLYSKAAAIKGISPGKLAGLEAIMKKMSTRNKTEVPIHAEIIEKDESLLLLMNEILAKYPQHKRVKFLKAKFENNEPISPTEIAELKKFKSILLKT